MANDDKEVVGYKKPPKQGQFTPGKSGNPSGKKLGTRSFASELQDILDEQITVAVGGVIKTVSKQKALASSLVSAAIEGDLKATQIVMTHLIRDASRTTGENDFGENDDFDAVRAHRKRKGKP